MKEDDPLPGLYFYHGASGQTVRFDAPFEDVEVTPKLLTLWMRSEMLKIDVAGLEEFIERYTA